MPIIACYKLWQKLGISIALVSLLLVSACDLLATQKGIVQFPENQRAAAEHIFGKSLVEKYLDRFVIIDSSIKSSGNPLAPAWYNAISDLVYVREHQVSYFIEAWALCHELTHVWQFTVLNYPWQDKSSSYSLPIPIAGKLDVEQEATLVEYYAKFEFGFFIEILDSNGITQHTEDQLPSYRLYMQNELRLPIP